MKLPRDLSGEKLARLLRRFGYEVTRQSGSHMRLTSAIKNFEHHLTIPAHKQLSVGTLAQILTDAASYLEVTKEQLAEELFGQAIAGPKRLAFGDFASLATAEGGSAG